MIKIIKKGFAIVDKDNKMILRTNASNKKEICMLNESTKQVGIWNSAKQAERIFNIDEKNNLSKQTQDYIKRAYKEFEDFDNIKWIDIKHLFTVKSIELEIVNHNNDYVNSNATFREYGFMIVSKCEKLIFKGTPRNRRLLLVDENNNQRFIIYSNQRQMNDILKTIKLIAPATYCSTIQYSSLANQYIEKTNVNIDWQINEYKLIYTIY